MSEGHFTRRLTLSSISITAKTAVVRNAKLSHWEFVHAGLESLANGW